MGFEGLGLMVLGKLGVKEKGADGSQGVRVGLNRVQGFWSCIFNFEV